jgi:4-amino-4-deoxy-L-arabinose transferase-like glycosyltransferase
MRQQSQTWDESHHLFAGYQYWKHGDFGINAEHPPLLKLVAAIPLLSLDLKEQPVAVGPTDTAHWASAAEFLYQNTIDHDIILFRSRMTASVFTYLLAVLVFLCGLEMFGFGAALLALFLLVFEPNILTHGALVTTDIAETCFVFASVYAFYRYVKKPNVGRLLICGVALGFSWAAKHSGLVVGPSLVLLAVADILLQRRRTGHEGAMGVPRPVVRQTRRYGLAIVGIFAVGIVLLWSCYAFRFAARPEGAALNPTLDVQARSLKNGMETNLVLALASRHVLPEAYLWGLSYVLGNADRGSFLLGKVYATGPWFYFPLVLMMKCTLGFLLLLAAFPVAAMRLRMPRELSFLVIPPTIFLAISMVFGLNIGLRHVLPIFPFLILLSAAAAMNLAARSRLVAGAIAVLVVAHATSSLHSYPNYLTYSNEVVGGPSNTRFVMSDSNVDWGQGFKQAAAYLAERQVTDCWFAYSIPISIVDPRFQGPCRPLPVGLGRITPPFPAVIEGTILISANEAAGQNWGPDGLNPYRQFFDKQPDDVIANSILVFRGSFDVSLASASSHAARARQLMIRDKLEDALREAQTAAQLFPDSADVQATLCLALALTQTTRKEETKGVCQAAFSIARRVHPEFQFLHVHSVRAIASWFK